MGGDSMKIKDLVVVALATFCLTSTLFMAVASRSADSPNWDPWADIKEDGTVDIYDAITLANAFGSSGDTPKNVNVTNWPPATTTAVHRANITWDGYGSGYSISPGWPEFTITGYSRMSVQLYVVDWYPHSTSGDNFTQLTATAGFWSIIPSEYGDLLPLSTNATVRIYMNYPDQLRTGITPETIETIAPLVHIYFSLETDVEVGSILFDVYVYLRNE
jgi:hypothetical protein